MLSTLFHSAQRCYTGFNFWRNSVKKHFIHSTALSTFIKNINSLICLSTCFMKNSVTYRIFGVMSVTVCFKGSSLSFKEKQVGVTRRRQLSHGAFEHQNAATPSGGSTSPGWCPDTPALLHPSMISDEGPCPKAHAHQFTVYYESCV